MLGQVAYHNEKLLLADFEHAGDKNALFLTPTLGLDHGCFFLDVILVFFAGFLGGTISIQETLLDGFFHQG